MIFRIFFVFIVVLLNRELCAQHSCDTHQGECSLNPIEFIANQNQFHENVLFEASIGGLDKVFLEDNAFTYVVHEDDAVQLLHDSKLKNNNTEFNQISVKGHAYKVEFLNAQQSSIRGNSKQNQFYNYFLGNDSARWASNVSVYHEAKYSSLYPGIDLLSYSSHGHLKYDFIVSPNADLDVLALKYEGVDDMTVNKEGDLVIKTSVKDIIEKAPVAYQEINNKRIFVDCNYILKDQIIRFDFPQGYDKNYPLVIDPEVVASTLTGTTISRNFGHTASFDNAGNIYLGGVSFGVGYPTETGSFQTFYGGGYTDMAVCKFNPDGTDLIYATYIGGGETDSPHSIVVDNNQQLCILGSTNSPDFPTTSNAFQKILGGMEDIALIKLNQNGSALVGSTFLGGTLTDGLNLSSLNTNYGEQFRGEIILDHQGNILVASNSSSSDFPITPNAFQSNLTIDIGNPLDNQDGVVFKMNSDLSTLFWSTYLGSNDMDTAFGIRSNDLGEIYITGTAGSENFPTTTGTYQSNWPGGEESAYIAVLSSNGQELLRSTFWGTDQDDHSYFLDIDEDENVHIYGQSKGVIPITPGAYSANPGSHQYLAAFTADLESLVYSTVIGNGPSSSGPFWFEYDFVPVAFMVDKCNGIYFSGYYAQPGLPLTADAIPGVNGNAFYLGVLEPDASALKFATYFGHADHVDGGTSRFDKGGVVYQAVCSCTGSQLETEPGAWAEGQTEYCDMGVFKIDFNISTVTSQASFDQSASGCAPYTIDFKYTGQDGESYFWDFGDGNSSNEENPSYTFVDPGSYTVMLVAENLNSCNLRDTAYTQIDVLDGTSSSRDTSICGGDNFLFLDATTQNASYTWQDGSTGASFQATSEGTYWVDIVIAGCSRRDTFNVNNSASIGNLLDESVNLCSANEYLIEIDNPDASTFLWEDNSSGSSLLVSSDGVYSVTVTDSEGCKVKDSIEVNFDAVPNVALGEDVFICEGQYVALESNFTQGEFLWQDGSTDPDLITNVPGVYTLEVTIDGCTGQDEVEVFPTPELDPDLGPDLVLCDESSITLDATLPNVISYLLNDGSTMPTKEFTTSGLKSVFVIDNYGCGVLEQIRIDFVDSPDFELKDTVLCEGQSLVLSAVSDAENYLWQDGSVMGTFEVNSSGEYWVEADNMGCITRDTANVEINPSFDIDLGEDQVLCENENILLDATTANASYEWQDGTSEANLLVSQPGLYSVVVDVNGCVGTDEIEILPSLAVDVDLGENQVLCDINEFYLDAQNEMIEVYQWSTGENSSSILASDDGLFWLEFEDVNGCISRDSIELTFGESPLIDIPDTTLCEGQQIVLNAFIEGATYEWQDGSNSASFEVEEAGTYSVSVELDGCSNLEEIEISNSVDLNVDLGEDQMYCDVPSVELNLENTLIQDYEWSNGSNAAKIEVNSNGLYWVEYIDIDGCISRDSIELTFGESPIINLSDTTLCQGQQVVLNAYSEGASYLWSDNSFTESIVVNQSGEYSVIALRDGCESRDTAIVDFASIPDYGIEVRDVLCYEECNGQIELITSNTNGDLNFEWSNGMTSPILNDLCADNYILKITDTYGCEYNDNVVVEQPDPLIFETNVLDVDCAGETNGLISINSIEGGVSPYMQSLNGVDFGDQTEFEDLSSGNFLVEIQDGNGCTTDAQVLIEEPDPIGVDAGDDFVIEIGETVQFNGSVTSNNDLMIEWVHPFDLSCDECLDPLTSPLETSIYELIVTDINTGCTERDQVQVEVNRPIKIYVPNAFSPNGDGSNERFTIFSNATVIEIKTLRVFDRWGEMVFENQDFMSNDLEAGWDGKFKEKDLNPGVFAFVAQVKLITGEEEIIKGEISLIR